MSKELIKYTLSTYILICILILVNYKADAHDWKNNSVLSSGKWVKIKTSKKGIYKISFTELKAWGFSNPDKVNIYGSKVKQLAEKPGEIESDDLEKYSIWYDEIDGINYLFFYAQGVVEWKIESGELVHKNHNYTTNESFYYLSDVDDVVKRPENVPTVSGNPDVITSEFDEYILYEKEKNNLLQSGKLWLGDRMILNTSKQIDYQLINRVANSPVKINVRAAARSSAKTKLLIENAGNSIGELLFNSVRKDDYIGNYADIKDETFIQSQLNNNSITLQYQTYQGIDEQSEAWLDYIKILYKRQLKIDNKPLFFRSISSVGANNISQFTISNVQSSVKILDVTNVTDIKILPHTLNNNIATIKTETDKLKELVAFNADASFLEPEKVEEVSNQNLHGLATPEFLIVTHAKFIEQANQLAQFHRTNDGMEVEVVDVSKVYNEFSAGIKDATAIRNFIKMLYDRSNKIKYVLLFGDGSYDNKDIKTTTQSFIPTFQSDESIRTIYSFVTDDYFVMLDDDEDIYDGTMDLGIGRIPAVDTYQAQVVLEKINNYHSEKALGSWRNTVCFIADDEDNNTHLKDSEVFAAQVNNQNKEYYTDKIYFDSFKQETIGGVERYPEVTKAINKRVEEGVLILNYVGHANPRFLADEHVIDISQINSWSNKYQLPIFMTATCEFSRFDTDVQSAGEYILFSPNGGGIGLFSTTRIVSSYYNKELSEEFYNCVFGKDNQGENYRMGDIIRITKNNTNNQTNKRNFTLLADPALRLTYPKNQVITETINARDASQSADTLGVLERITIKGYIADENGIKLTDFNGELTPTIFDKAVKITTLGNNGEPKISYDVFENILYKGVTDVVDGEFTFTFVVPKDISYTIGKGKIVYYAENGVTDANGAFENFYIGGSSGSNITDTEGPEINLYLDSKEFNSGDETGVNPTLIAELSDDNGINTLGAGIGHDIIAVLDNDYTNVFVLNKYYKSNRGDYTSGRLTFALNNLEEGKHTLTLKVWDVANNSSEKTIEFFVSSEFKITSVSNSPNPLSQETLFSFEHTESGAILNTIIQIYDMHGRRIDIIREKVGSNGTKSNDIRWSRFRSNASISSGIYIYQIAAENNKGKVAIKTGKMIITD